MVFLGPSARSLHFAVRPAVVARHLGLLYLPLAALVSVPLAVSAAAREWSVAGRFAVVVAFLAAFGLLASRLRPSSHVQANEAVSVTVLAFASTALLAALPLAAHGIPPGDALFESVSAITTTGLSTLASVEERSFTFLFARSWLQWVGGLGVAVLAIAFVLHPGTDARRLGFEPREADDPVGGSRAHARRVLRVYAAITVLAIALLWALGAGLAEGLTHALAAVSTGGFSSHDESLAGFASPWVRAGATAVSFLGAVSFATYYQGRYRRLAALARDGRLATLLGLALATVVLLGVLDRREGVTPAAAWGDALVLGFSAQTTTGFSSVAVGELSDAAKLVLVLAMTIGGEIGSTAGGIKILRFVLLVLVLRRILVRASLARGSDVPLRLGRSPVGASEVEGAVAVVGAHLAVLALSWLAFLVGGHAPLDALVEVASALGTVGLSTGIAGPDLAPALKGVLCVDMLIGRVEPVAFLLVLFPPTWIGRRRSWR